MMMALKYYGIDIDPSMIHDDDNIIVLVARRKDVVVVSLSTYHGQTSPLCDWTVRVTAILHCAKSRLLIM